MKPRSSLAPRSPQWRPRCWLPRAAQAQEEAIRASLVVAKDHSLGVGLHQQVQQCVAQKSGRQDEDQAFFDGSLGTDAATVQQMRTGTLDMVVTATSVHGHGGAGGGVFDLPFLFANEKEADAALDGRRRAADAEAPPRRHS
jgi:TRAP-type C4-dicarboxylate transport system substrate-binding protein